MIFSTVFGPQEPALTVGSLAISATGRPPIVAMPVTTPSAPKPSCSQLASSASSTNESGVDAAARRARARAACPARCDFSWWRSGPPPRARSSASFRSDMASNVSLRAARSCDRSAAADQLQAALAHDAGADAGAERCAIPAARAASSPNASRPMPRPASAPISTAAMLAGVSDCRGRAARFQRRPPAPLPLRDTSSMGSHGAHGTRRQRTAARSGTWCSTGPRSATP